MTIKLKTKKEVFERDGGRCVECGSYSPLEKVPHHCFYKSKYFGDNRDDAWNLVTICQDCYWDIHSSGTKKGKELRYKLEEVARERNPEWN